VNKDNYNEDVIYEISPRYAIRYNNVKKYITFIRGETQEPMRWRGTVMKIFEDNLFLYIAVDEK